MPYRYITSPYIEYINIHDVVGGSGSSAKLILALSGMFNYHLLGWAMKKHQQVHWL
jgi:hypothetical protein